MVNAAGWHFELELVRRRRVFTEGLVFRLATNWANGVIQRGSVDTYFGIAGLHLHDNATALGQLGDFAHGKTTGVEQFDGIHFRRLVAQQIDRDIFFGFVTAWIAGDDAQLQRQGFRQVVGATQVFSNAAQRQAAHIRRAQQ